MSRTAEISAPAKLNLYLKVVERLPSGYHRIESLFMPVFALADRLKVDFDAPSGIGFSCPGGAPADATNLAFRAAQLYAECAKLPPTWHIALEKHIPTAAGMGGGSSDAASVLKLLNSRYGAFAPDELAKLASSLGADVPFFLAPAWAVVGGAGEIITPMEDPPPDVHAVIVKPPFPISAKWAYTHLDPAKFGAEPGAAEKLLNALRRGEIELANSLMKNDLSYAILRKFPVYEAVEKAVLSAVGLTPMITGSGSAMFTLVRSADEGISLREELAQRFENWRVAAI